MFFVAFQIDFETPNPALIARTCLNCFTWVSKTQYDVIFCFNNPGCPNFEKLGKARVRHRLSLE